MDNGKRMLDFELLDIINGKLVRLFNYWGVIFVIVVLICIFIEK